MNGSPSIRPGRASDLSELVRLEQVAFRADRFSKRQVRYLLTRAHGTVLVLESGEGLAGAVYLLWRRSGASGRLYNIAVDPAYQRKGLGALLLQAAEDEAALRNCRRLSLEVRSDNTTAIDFYEDHGYRIVDDLPGYYDNDVPGWRMVKPLLPPRTI